MKTKTFLMACIVLLFLGCNSNEPDYFPKADFSYTVDELKVSFINHSLNASRYEWTFGNGKTSNEENPTITYADDGTYFVSLTAYNGDNSSYYSEEITVSSKTPTAKFTYKTVQPLSVILTNTSQNATSYLWDFGDGTTSTDADPEVHRYATFGVYQITLTAKNGYKKSTYKQSVTITQPTTCYFRGFDVYKIPYNNCYYQFQLTDDYTFSKTTYLWTNWFLLSSANLPYSYMFESFKQLDISKDYVARLYVTSSGNPSGQADGKGDYFGKIQSSLLKTYPEILPWSTNEIDLDLYFYWK